MPKANISEKKERVSVFIDGFNLYFGLKSAFPQLKWLNVYLLSQNLLKPNQTLIEVYYFTARIKNNPPKEQRQGTYISAIKSTPTKIIYGQYKSKQKECRNCGHRWLTNEEKMTDVNIAMHMFTDAFQDRFDRAILISGDSDLVPPIKSVQQHFNKKVFVVFPPNRHNNSVKQIADGSMMLGRGKISNSQFETEIKLDNNYRINKPDEWL